MPPVRPSARDLYSAWVLALGWVAGLFASAAIGGLVIWLASKRLLTDATACLAALGMRRLIISADARETDRRPTASGPGVSSL